MDNQFSNRTESDPKRPLVSICIPSEGNVNWAIPTIESFYQDGVDLELFEVICTDNGKKDDLSVAIKRFDYPNFHYYRTTSKGYVNQIDALERSSGLFCKLHNSRSPLLPGMLRDILDLANKYMDCRPIIFCSNGSPRFKEVTTECATLDSFVRTLGISSTWSGGVCAWREDIDALHGTPSNETFPHVKYLYDCGDNSKYIIYNKRLANPLDDAGKGGTNPFRDFLWTYPNILKGLLDSGRITDETFNYMKETLFKFMRRAYINEIILPTAHTFDTSGLRDSMKEWYGDLRYCQLIVSAYLYLPQAIWGRLKRKMRH